MKKSGTIEALNVSPKGFYEGFLLRTAKGVVQVNLPHGKAANFEAVMALGKEVVVEVKLEDAREAASHSVYKLVHIEDREVPSKAASRAFTGKVKSLNYALHGEVNGGILVSGDFLHLKPKGARAVELKVGMNVRGLGATRPIVGGRQVIEADEVNGIQLGRGKAPKKHAEKQAKKRSPKRGIAL